MSKQAKYAVEPDAIRNRFDLYDSLFKKIEEKLNNLEGIRHEFGHDENSGIGYITRLRKLEDKLLDQKIQFEKKFLSQEEKLKAIMSRLEKLDRIEGNYKTVMKSFDNLSAKVGHIQGQLETSPQNIQNLSKKKNNLRGIGDENERPLMTFQDTNRKFFVDQSSSKKLGEKLLLPDESCDKHLISYTNSPNFANNSHTASPIHTKNQNNPVLQNTIYANNINPQEQLPRNQHTSNHTNKSQLENSKNNNDNYQKISNDGLKQRNSNIYPQSVKNSREILIPSSSSSINHKIQVPYSQAAQNRLLANGLVEQDPKQNNSHCLPTSTKRHPSSNATIDVDSFRNTNHQAPPKHPLSDMNQRASLNSINKATLAVNTERIDSKRSIRSNSMQDSNQPTLRSLEIDIPFATNNNTNRPSIKYDYYFETNRNSTKSNKCGFAGINSTTGFSSLASPISDSLSPSVQQKNNSQQRPPMQMRTVEAFSQYENYQPLYSSSQTTKASSSQHFQQGRSESVDNSKLRQRKIDEQTDKRINHKTDPIFSTIDINGRIGEQQQQQKLTDYSIKNFQHTPKGTQHSKTKEMLGRLTLERKVKEEKIQQFEKQAHSVKRSYEF